MTNMADYYTAKDEIEVRNDEFLLRANNEEFVENQDNNK